MNKVSCSSFLSPWIASSDVPSPGCEPPELGGESDELNALALEPNDYEHMDFESFIAAG